MHYTRNKTRNHANHIREYQSQLWKDFLSLRTLQRSLIQTATLYKHLPFTISMPYIYNSTRRDQRKNQRTAWFPESSNQTAANQSNGRCSPTAFEVGYSVLAETWTNFLVTNQGRAEMRLEAKTEMCVPYGTEAQVHGSQVANIRLMVRGS